MVEVEEGRLTSMKLHALGKRVLNRALACEQGCHRHKAHFVPFEFEYTQDWYEDVLFLASLPLVKRSIRFLWLPSTLEAFNGPKALGPSSLKKRWTVRDQDRSANEFRSIHTYKGRDIGTFKSIMLPQCPRRY